LVSVVHIWCCRPVKYEAGDLSKVQLCYIIKVVEYRIWYKWVLTERKKCLKIFLTIVYENLLGEP
jgi:hypothetical protein